MSKAEVVRNFTYWPPRSEEQIEAHKIVREAGKDLACVLFDFVPDSPEKTIALRKVEEAVMWANAGIARPPLQKA
jgi:hypothetical protein